MNKEDLNGLLDNIYELEGLVHLALAREDCPESLPGLIVRKAKSLFEQVKPFDAPEAVSPQAEENLSVSRSQEEPVADNLTEIGNVADNDAVDNDAADNENDMPVETQAVIDDGISEDVISESEDVEEILSEQPGSADVVNIEEIEDSAFSSYTLPAEDDQMAESSLAVNDLSAEEQVVSMDETITGEFKSDIDKTVGVTPAFQPRAAAESQNVNVKKNVEPRGKLVFTINDRYRFKRDLFCNSDADFNTTLALVASMDSYDEAEDYFLGELQWNPQREEVLDFLEILKNYFK